MVRVPRVCSPRRGFATLGYDRGSRWDPFARAAGEDRGLTPSALVPSRQCPLGALGNTIPKNVVRARAISKSSGRERYPERCRRNSSL